jgi:hypothetical protein
LEVRCLPPWSPFLNPIEEAKASEYTRYFWWCDCCKKWRIGSYVLSIENFDGMRRRSTTFNYSSKMLSLVQSHVCLHTKLSSGSRNRLLGIFLRILINSIVKFAKLIVYFGLLISKFGFITT